MLLEKNPCQIGLGFRHSGYLLSSQLWCRIAGPSGLSISEETWNLKEVLNKETENERNIKPEGEMFTWIINEIKLAFNLMSSNALNHS